MSWSRKSGCKSSERSHGDTICVPQGTWYRSRRRSGTSHPGRRIANNHPTAPHPAAPPYAACEARNVTGERASERNVARQPGMNNVVLDASAILAVVNGEAGQEKLTPEVIAAGTLQYRTNLAEVEREAGQPGMVARRYQRGCDGSSSSGRALQPRTPARVAGRSGGTNPGTLVSLSETGLALPWDSDEGPCFIRPNRLDKTQAWHPCRVIR